MSRPNLKHIVMASWSIAAVKATSNPALQLSSLPDLPELHLTNHSAPSVTSSLEAGFEVDCNGDHFGYDLNFGDCQNAESYLAPDAEQQIFAPRDSQIGRDFNSLPWRLMGGECQKTDRTPRATAEEMAATRQSRVFHPNDPENERTFCHGQSRPDQACRQIDNFEMCCGHAIDGRGRHNDW